jgi:hypothetical protein
VGLFDFLKPKDKIQQRLMNLISHNVDMIRNREGRTRADAEYIAICIIIDDLRERPNGRAGHKMMMDILQKHYPMHLNDVITYVGWSTGQINLKPEAEVDLRERHARKGPREDATSKTLGFTEKDGEKLILAEAEECISKISDRWLYYNEKLKFKPDVRLAEIIEGFAMPMQEFVRMSYPLLDAAGPRFFWMVVFHGIQRTGSPSLDAINQAIEEIDAKLRNA